MQRSGSRDGRPLVTKPRVDRADATVPARREPWVWLARLTLAALIGVVMTWVARRTSWYLAIDQFGYLTFAQDLAQGRVAHDWPMLAVLRKFLPPTFQADVLAFTYVYDDGDLYCRYAPGFPLMLAAASLLFGPEATHFVNPIAIGVLLLTLYWLVRRATGSEWLGLAVPLLVTLLPTYVLLWSISPLRDVPAHTTALAGLALLLPVAGARRSVGRWMLAGILLGFTISIRVDAVLYGIPALGLAWFWRPWRVRDFVGATAAVLIGALPILAYNTVATGNPLRPTQAMELDRVLSRAPEPPPPEATFLAAVANVVAPSAAHAQVEGQTRREQRERLLLQGGGLRLGNLRTTLPQNLQIYLLVFGPLGVALGGIGAIVSLRRLPLFLLAVPYIVLATSFFSLWPRADPRYLAGGILLFALLVVHGGHAVAMATAEMRKRGFGAAACVAAAVALIGVVAWGLGPPDFAETSARPYVTIVLGAALAAALLWGAVVAPGHPQWVFAIGLALGLACVAGWRTASSIERRGSFQEREVQVARETVESAVGDNAVIFTTSDIGRPGENINFYTEATAVYLREVYRWGATPGYILDQVVKAGFEAYLLLPPDVALTWIQSNYVHPWFRPEMVADIPASEARRWFVASAGHQGVPLWLVRMHPRPAPLEEKQGE